MRSRAGQSQRCTRAPSRPPSTTLVTLRTCSSGPFVKPLPPEAANDAREVLVNLYMRLGRSSDMIRLLDDAIATAPSRSDLRNVRQASSRSDVSPISPREWAIIDPFGAT
jgi:hypothetical protein